MNENITITSTDSSCISCIHFPECSGCVKQDDLSDNHENKILERKLDRPINLLIDGIKGYRHKVKLAIGGNFSNPLIGLYKKNSHDIVSIPDCPLHTPGINEFIDQVIKTIKKTEVSIYSENSFQGLLRYIQIVEDKTSKALSVTFVVCEKLENACNHKFFKSLLEKAPNIESLWLNEKTTRDNAIFGKKWKLIFGKEFSEQEIHKRKFFFHPSSFCQIHLKQYENLLLDLKANIKPQSKVLELYAGIGTIGYSVLEKVKSIDCFESNPFAKLCFDKGNEYNFRKNINFFPYPSENFDNLKDYDVAIIDPPRKGLSKIVLDKLHRSKGIQEIHLIYCDYNVFLDNIDKFQSLGWIIEDIKTYLFFPGSGHIEIYCKIKRF